MAHFNAFWDFDDRTTLRLRIGTSGDNGFAFEGHTFPTWADWKSFLTHNAHRLTIKSTAGDQVVSVDDFVMMIEGTNRHHLLDWYQETTVRMKKVDNAGRAKGKVWWDDQGFFFRNDNL